MKILIIIQSCKYNISPGLETEEDSRVMIMGATNRPEDVDTAILRRMVATFHIGLPVSSLKTIPFPP